MPTAQIRDLSADEVALLKQKGIDPAGYVVDPSTDEFVPRSEFEHGLLGNAFADYWGAQREAARTATEGVGKAIEFPGTIADALREKTNGRDSGVIRGIEGGINRLLGIGEKPSGGVLDWSHTGSESMARPVDSVQVIPGSDESVLSTAGRGITNLAEKYLTGPSTEDLTPGMGIAKHVGSAAGSILPLVLGGFAGELPAAATVAEMMLGGAQNTADRYKGVNPEATKAEQAARGLAYLPVSAAEQVGLGALGPIADIMPGATGVAQMANRLKAGKGGNFLTTAAKEAIAGGVGTGADVATREVLGGEGLNPEEIGTASLSGAVAQGLTGGVAHGLVRRGEGTDATAIKAKAAELAKGKAAATKAATDAEAAAAANLKVKAILETQRQAGRWKPPGATEKDTLIDDAIAAGVPFTPESLTAVLKEPNIQKAGALIQNIFNEARASGMNVKPPVAAEKLAAEKRKQVDALNGEIDANLAQAQKIQGDIDKLIKAQQDNPPTDQAGNEWAALHLQELQARRAHLAGIKQNIIDLQGKRALLTAEPPANPTQGAPGRIAAEGQMGGRPMSELKAKSRLLTPEEIFKQQLAEKQAQDTAAAAAEALKGATARGVARPPKTPIGEMAPPEHAPEKEAFMKGEMLPGMQPEGEQGLPFSGEGETGTAEPYYGLWAPPGVKKAAQRIWDVLRDEFTAEHGEETPGAFVNKIVPGTEVLENAARKQEDAGKALAEQAKALTKLQDEHESGIGKLYDEADRRYSRLVEEKVARRDEIRQAAQRLARLRRNDPAREQVLLELDAANKAFNEADALAEEARNHYSEVSESYWISKNKVDRAYENLLNSPARRLKSEAMRTYIDWHAGLSTMVEGHKRSLSPKEFETMVDEIYKHQDEYFVTPGGYIYENYGKDDIRTGLATKLFDGLPAHPAVIPEIFKSLPRHNLIRLMEGLTTPVSILRQRLVWPDSETVTKRDANKWLEAVHAARVKGNEALASTYLYTPTKWFTRHLDWLPELYEPQSKNIVDWLIAKDAQSEQFTRVRQAHGPLGEVREFRYTDLLGEIQPEDVPNRRASLDEVFGRVNARREAEFKQRYGDDYALATPWWIDAVKPAGWQEVKTSHELSRIAESLHNCAASYAPSAKDGRTHLIYKADPPTLAEVGPDAVVHQVMLDHNKRSEAGWAELRSLLGQKKREADVRNQIIDIGEAVQPLAHNEQGEEFFSAVVPPHLARDFGAWFKETAWPFLRRNKVKAVDPVTLLYQATIEEKARWAERGPDGVIVASNIDRVFVERNKLANRKLQELAAFEKEFPGVLENPEFTKWRNHARNTGTDGFEVLPPELLPAAQQWDLYRKSFHEEQRAAGVAVMAHEGGRRVWREAIDEPGWDMNAIDKAVYEAMERGDEAWDAFKKEWTEAWIERHGTEDGAAESLMGFTAPLAHTRTVGGEPLFGAVRNEMGMPPPEGWRSKNYKEGVEDWIKKWAADMAWAEVVQKSPMMRRAFGITRDPMGVDTRAEDAAYRPSQAEWEKILTEGEKLRPKWYSEVSADMPMGQVIKANESAALLASYTRTANSGSLPRALARAWEGANQVGGTLMMEHMSKARNILQSGFTVLDYALSPDFIPVMRAVRDSFIAPGVALRRAQEAGALELDTMQHEAADALSGALYNTAGFARKWTGLNAMDAYAKALAYNVARAATEFQISKYGYESPLVKEFGPVIGEGMTESQVAELTAATIANHVDPQFDSRSLPGWATPQSRGFLGNMMRLMTWSVGRFNHWYRDAWVPLITHGDGTRFVKSMVVGGLGAVATQSFLAWLQDKMPRDLTLNEWFKLQKPEQLKELGPMAFGYLQAQGHMGILGDILYSGMRTAAGKPILQDYSRPMVPGLLVGRDLATTLIDFREYAAKERGWKNLDATDFMKLGVEMAKLSQTMRNVIERGDSWMPRRLQKEAQDMKDKREQRVFEEVTGRSVLTGEPRDPLGIGGQSRNAFIKNPFSLQKEFTLREGPELQALMPSLTAAAIAGWSPKTQKGTQAPAFYRDVAERRGQSVAESLLSRDIEKEKDRLRKKAAVGGLGRIAAASRKVQALKADAASADE